MSSMPVQSNQGWLDTQWSDRNIVTVINSGNTQLSNFQVHVTLGSTFDFTKTNSDGSDIRFTTDDGVTEISFWIETWDAVNHTASLWLKAPMVPVGGINLYMYYGNANAASTSSGETTFEFFDDFEVDTPAFGYYNLGAPDTVMVQDQPWETAAPHTMSVVQNNSGGYAYSGYYGLQADCGGVGLALSNDLKTWTKQTSPLFLNGRWPSVLKVGDIFYMLYTKDFCATSYIVLAESSDGINFIDVKTIVESEVDTTNQNPNLFYNTNDGNYYIYWFNGVASSNYIRARSATTIENLDDPTSETIVLQNSLIMAPTNILAAPNMMFHDGTYFLSTESQDSNGNWTTLVYGSTAPTSGFFILPGSPTLVDGSACMFQHIFGTELHEYFCKQNTTTGIWTLDHRVADMTAGQTIVPGQNSFDPIKWLPTGGSWTISTGTTQQNGTVGGVMQGTIGLSARETLHSIYNGNDYVMEVYGKQVSGRLWGVGIRAKDQNNLYSVNLYDDLNGTNNLYLYDWVNGSASVLNKTAVGVITPKAWHKLTVKTHGNAINVYKNDILTLQTSSSEYATGAIALYGEQNTVAQFNNLLVRKYTDVEPIAIVNIGTPLTVSAPQFSPGSLVGGGVSQGIVILSSPAPVGGTLVSLSSSDPLMASVPATVLVLGGETSATFTINTNPTLSTNLLNITATYGASSQTSVLTVTPPLGVNWLDVAWTNRSEIAIVNSSETALSNFQVHVTLDGTFDFAKAKADGSDVRFTTGDGFTLIPFWLETWDPANHKASMWVKASTIPTAGTTLYMYYGNSVVASASNGTATFEFFDNFDSGSTNFDPGKWTATGGTWTVAAAAVQQDGTIGAVMQGSIGSSVRQALRSTYTGTDYVLEAYGKQLSGRLWGLGVQSADQNNLYSINLYEDIDGANNLYAYDWVNGSASVLNKSAVGVINPNAWYKLAVKAHGNAIEVYKDGVLTLQTSSPDFAAGAVALYGEQNTVAQFNNVLVRKYASVEPTVTVMGSPLTVNSLQLNPANLVGGGVSQGTVVLSGVAPSGGVVIALNSSNPLAVNVPATVAVPSGASSASFTMNTSVVSSPALVTISSGYGGSSQTATITINAQPVEGWLDPAWNSRSAVTVVNPSGTDLSNFQVHVILDNTFDFTKANNDGSDVRFTTSDGFTLVPFWVETWDAVNHKASVWVKAPTVPTAGTTLYMYYGNFVTTSASNGTATFEFFDDFDSGSTNFDTGKWAATAGTWAIANTTTQQNGTTGGVLQGTIGNSLRQALRSTYTGSDYVLEAYGKQVSGRVMGLGVRSTDQNNLYSINLYEDLDGTNNLYAYDWVSGNASTLNNAAVGVVNINAWYKLGVRVHGSAIDVYKDDVLMLQTSSSRYIAGAIALYGEQNTVAQFNNVLVRKYASVEPTTTVTP
ncbi:DUF2341 domain-containing protein [Methylobacter sp. S3L5C]|uniref:DUF2341 domain-containing protein n=1 Tax=Methylobacter sp. S3L5C TaxID=2839024 RepID=UPI001FABDE43|nr:DUF2341 domain-containing protein [Methylobacter sp. S3L5C]UOA10209.1 DUF2341 domain-containing protein [Methylobacter sp. S3L5C]